MSALPPLATVRADIAVGPLRAEAVAISPASLNNAQHGRGLRVFHLADVAFDLDHFVLAYLGSLSGALSAWCAMEPRYAY